jgi:hypothetical protein
MALAFCWAVKRLFQREEVSIFEKPVHYHRNAIVALRDWQALNEINRYVLPYSFRNWQGPQ